MGKAARAVRPRADERAFGKTVPTSRRQRVSGRPLHRRRSDDVQRAAHFAQHGRARRVPKSRGVSRPLRGEARFQTGDCRTTWRLPKERRLTKERNSMAYIDGFVIAAPTADKEKFRDHAGRMHTIFIEFGATRVVEAWGDDVPDGKLTDFKRAVQAKNDETVVFSWVEWPDKATRDAAMQKFRTDPRMTNPSEPMPFDGKRMIFGGFVPALELKK